MFSFKYSPRPNTLALKRMPDDVTEEEKTRRIVALQNLQKEIQGQLFDAAVGQERRARGRPEPSSRLGAVRTHEREHRREFLGRPDVDRTPGRRPDHGREPEQPSREVQQPPARLDSEEVRA